MSEPSPVKRRSLAVRLLIGFGLTFLVVLGLALGRGYFAFHDRLPGFAFDLQIQSKPAVGLPALRVGFAREKINPDLSDLGSDYY